MSGATSASHCSTRSWRTFSELMFQVAKRITTAASALATRACLGRDAAVGRRLRRRRRCLRSRPGPSSPLHAVLHGRRRRLAGRRRLRRRPSSPAPSPAAACWSGVVGAVRLPGPSWAAAFVGRRQSAFGGCLPAAAAPAPRSTSAWRHRRPRFGRGDGFGQLVQLGRRHDLGVRRHCGTARSMLRRAGAKLATTSVTASPTASPHGRCAAAGRTSAAAARSRGRRRSNVGAVRRVATRRRR